MTTAVIHHRPKRADENIEMQQVKRVQIGETSGVVRGAAVSAGPRKAVIEEYDEDEYDDGDGTNWESSDDPRLRRGSIAI